MVVRQESRKRGASAVMAAVRASGHSLAEVGRETPGLLAVGVAAFVVQALLPGAQVSAVAWLTHAVLDGRRTVLPLVLLAFTVALNQVASSVSGRVSQSVSMAQEARQRHQLLEGIARLSPQRLATPQVAAYIQASRESLFDTSRFAYGVLNALSAIAAGVGVCLAVVRIDAVAGLLIVAALLPYLAASSLAARTSSRAWAPLGALRRHVLYEEEQLAGQRTGTELVTLGTGTRMAQLADTHQREQNRLQAAVYTRRTVADLCAVLAAGSLLAAALWSLLRSGAGVSGVAAGVVGVIGGMAAVQGAGFSLEMVVANAPKVTKFVEFLASMPDASPQQVVGRVDELRAEHLTVTYPGADSPALEDASLVVRRGEVVALVGINGAGKTTLANALLGIVDAQAGQVLIDGRDAATMSPAERLSHFGLLTQEFGRYELTVRQVVCLGSPHEATDGDVWRALDAAKIADLVRGMPDGLDTQLGQQWGGVGLSGGQWQRLALARIHLRGAGIWILDEPTSAIDAEAEQRVFDELHAGREERMTLVVSHRAWTLRRMDRIHVLDHGRIVESGTYDELLAAGGRFAQIFAEQAG